MVTLSLIKEARIYNGEKTASSVSGAGKLDRTATRKRMKLEPKVSRRKETIKIRSEINEKEKRSWRNQAP